MNLLLILAHPHEGSFNHALARAVEETARAAGHEVTFRDLYADGFDPLLTGAELARDAVLSPEVERGCAEAEAADVVAVIHPNWWSAPPAILQGWTDRCLRAGRAYRFVPDGQGGARPEGLLKARTALVLNTANTPQEVEERAFGDPLQVHWVKVVFGLCGVPRIIRRNFSPVITSSAEQRARWLVETRDLTLEALNAQAGGATAWGDSR